MNVSIIKRLIAAMIALALLMSCACAEILDEGADVSDEAWQEAVESDQANVSGSDDDWINILLLGCDSYSVNDYSRSDSMIILSINTKTSAIKMTSLMRDTWIKVSGHKARKLTELCAVGGPELTMQAINENYGTNLTRYALVGMDGIAEIIDLVGGLELDVTEAERKALNKGLFDLSGLSGMEKLQESGEQVHLNGNQATAFARIRKIDSDYVRVERQRTVLMAMAKKIMGGVSMGNVLSVINVLLEYVDTNMNLMDIVSLAKLGMSADLDSIEEMRLPADGTFQSGMFGDVWCIKPDFKKNAALLKDFIYG